MWRRSGNPQPATGRFQKSGLQTYDRSSGDIEVDLLHAALCDPPARSQLKKDGHENEG